MDVLIREEWQRGTGEPDGVFASSASARARQNGVEHADLIERELARPVGVFGQRNGRYVDRTAVRLPATVAESHWALSPWGPRCRPGRTIQAAP